MHIYIVHVHHTSYIIPLLYISHPVNTLYILPPLQHVQSLSTPKNKCASSFHRVQWSQCTCFKWDPVGGLQWARPIHLAGCWGCEREPALHPQDIRPGAEAEEGLCTHRTAYRGGYSALHCIWRDKSVPDLQGGDKRGFPRCARVCPVLRRGSENSWGAKRFGGTLLGCCMYAVHLALGLETCCC
jgi:hypothetical protein